MVLELGEYCHRSCLKGRDSGSQTSKLEAGQTINVGSKDVVISLGGTTTVCGSDGEADDCPVALDARSCTIWMDSVPEMVQAIVMAIVSRKATG